ncbi:hypothetical protein ACAF76_016110 [Brevibacillus sp. TJ4]|uniref:hypothetical protein n=1 Tax=Brevibacillus sp. TJ4 TaxID=3234853 RepID=UPI0037D1EE24
MGNQEPRLSQDVLLGIMLQAYLLGTQKHDIGARALIDRLAEELRPYFSREELASRAISYNTSNRQEAAG